MKISPAMEEQIREVAQGFESAFIRRMLDAMQRAQLNEGFFGSSATGKTRSAQFQAVLSDLLAESEPLGLAEQIRAELTEQMGTDGGEKRAAPPPDWFNIFRWEAQEAPDDAEESGG